MEGLTNESESEETVPVPKSIFKRQTSASIPRFDVSLNESNSENAQLDKSDTSPTISVPRKSSLFEKARKPSQHNFSVNFDESNVNSETESSITVDFVKPKLPFKRKAVSSASNVITNQFDVTFNETDANVSDKSSLGEINSDVDDESTVSVSLAAKSNPFKKPKPPSKNVFNIEFDETNDGDSSLSTTLPKEMFKKQVGKPLDNFQVSFSETNNDLVSYLNDKTEEKLSQDDFTSEKEVFIKPSNNNVVDAFNVEYEESDFGENSEVTSTTNSKCIFKAPTHSFQNFEVSFSPTVPQIESSSSSSQEQKSRDDSIINSHSEINDEEEDNCNDKDVDSSKELSMSNQKSRIESVMDGDSEMNAAEENCHSTDAENSKESHTNNDKETPPEKNDERSEALKEIQHEERQCIEPIFENLSSNESQVNMTNRSNRSEMYLDQSSVNDENLNHWMSDHSDESPTVPTISKNGLFTEEPPQAVKPVPPTQTCTMTWEQKFNEIVSNSKKKNQLQEFNHLNLGKKSRTQVTKKPKQDKGQGDEKSNRVKQPKLIKPAYFATKKLYQYIIRKLEPKFGIDTLVKSEEIVLSICDTVKQVERRKTHQKKLIQDLKKEMASVGLIETTVDFYEFVIKFLPDSFRVKVIPCIQPITNTVFPPKDTINPFDKIL